MVTLADVKNALGITGIYQDDTLQIYFDEVIAFLVDAGVPESNITSGIVARGVSDLWNYGGGDGKLSQYFVQRAIQLTKFKPSTNSGGGGKARLVEKVITENGRYNPADDNADGYSLVDVDVPSPALLQKIITENGDYNANDDNADGYSAVHVAVPVPVPVLITKSITQNGDFHAADDNADGYSDVHVAVEAPAPVLITKSITKNGTYAAQDDNADGYSQVTVNVPPTLFRSIVDRSIAGSITAEDLAGVTKIGNYAFYGCEDLTSCEIPSGVTMIGTSAFRYSSGLQRITLLATTPPTLSNANAFDYTNNCPIYVPAASVETYKGATNWSAVASRIQAIQE